MSQTPNDDPRDGDPRAAAGQVLSFTPPELWDSDTYWDGAISPLQTRRAELLTPGERANWWNDLRVWTDWLVTQYRLSNDVLPCWPRHPAIVEELQSLWLAWQAAWLAGTDPEAPARWQGQLDLALDRINRRWRFGGCSASSHEAPVAITTPYSAAVSPNTPGFAPHVEAVMQTW